MAKQKSIVDLYGNKRGFDRPWPVHCTSGCESISSGCDVCTWRWVAENPQKRFFPKGFGDVKENPRALITPSKRKKPTWFKLSPHADMFQDRISDEYLLEVFQVIAGNQQHLFQVTTKYTHRMKRFFNDVLPADLAAKCTNLIVGVNIETQEYAWRLYELNSWPYAKFVEFKPILGEITEVDLSVVELVTIATPYSRDIGMVKMEWILNVINMARNLNIPVSVDWVYQIGGVERYPHIDGRRWMGQSKTYLDWRQRSESEWFKG